MTDEQISEIYSLARHLLLGRPSFQVQAYPFRLTPEICAASQQSQPRVLENAQDRQRSFRDDQLEPKVDVCDRRYVFDAQAAPNSPQPLMFDPVKKCPAFVVNPDIARRALDKQRADELEYARLVENDCGTRQFTADWMAE